MCDERLTAQISNGNASAPGEGMFRRHDKYQRISVQSRRNQARIAGIVADHAQFEIAVDELSGDLARKAAAHLYFHLAIQPPVALDVTEQIQRCRLVRSDHQASGRIVAKFSERVLHLLAQIFKPPRELE